MFQLRLNWSFLLTSEAVESLAVSDDGQRVVVVELVVELVRVGVQVSGLWRFGVVLRRVLLLAGVVCVTALRTEAGGKERAKDGFLRALGVVKVPASSLPLSALRSAMVVVGAVSSVSGTLLSFHLR